MTLQLRLDDTTFDELVELGRSSIPGLAPDWTDHNIHDPGVMLVELTAWVADAQIYALSRMRRDERQAYAALLGVAPRPPRPAKALVWPRSAEPKHPAIGLTLPEGTQVSADRPNAPPFSLSEELFLTPAKLISVTSRFADGRTADFTQANGENRVSFMPFGASPVPGDVLTLGFDAPLRLAGSGDAPIAIGVEAVPRESAADDDQPASGQDRLRVDLLHKRGLRRVELLSDTTRGLLRSGVLLIRPPAGEAGETRCQLVIRSATGGFLRAPRLLRFRPNVLQVTQRRIVEEEAPDFGTGAPDQTYFLQTPGLTDEAALQVQTLEGASVEIWTAAGDLSACGPDDRVFALDLAEGALRFGNGLNGRSPPSGATLQLNFPISEGARGALPAGSAWSVSGFAGVYGESLSTASGGRDADRLDDVHGVARAKLAERTVLVTASDLERAALALPELGVKRAAELASSRRRPRGARVLVVAIDRDEAGETVTESREWLAEIRSRLAPRLPLGERLDVVAPSYAPVRIRTRLLAGPSIDPETVRLAAEKALRDRLAPVPIDGREAWPFGRDLSVLTVRGWLRRLPGVVRVADVTICADGAPAERALRIAGRMLPRLELEPGDVIVEPATIGAAS